jgi:hypothetical protein
MITQTMKVYSEPQASGGNIPARVNADLNNAALGKLSFCGTLQLGTNVVFWAIYEYDDAR